MPLGAPREFQCGDSSSHPLRETAGNAPPMPSTSSPAISLETAYFVNSGLPCVALIAKGVRFPRGQWLRLADGKVLPWLAERLVGDLFPTLKHKPISFAALLTEFDVKEFEAGLYEMS